MFGSTPINGDRANTSDYAGQENKKEAKVKRFWKFDQREGGC